MPSELENSSAMTVSNSASGENSVSSGHQVPPPPAAPVKKKRNLPGMPDPDAEVIALSPKTLMATNRFVCEICSKGFQRDQNLQLHRRGHNLPWKLRQRTGKEIRKRVYVCPEPSCVHHDPSRALGDLTGIKKHFCRKHGEKKWKCDKCSKKYAVQSDWKAHSKTCGSREYRCHCGTLFSRRDSFITHKAFCDALVEERTSARPTSSAARSEEDDAKAAAAATSIPSGALVQQTDPLAPPPPRAPPPQPPPPEDSEEPDNSAGMLHYMPPPMSVDTSSGSGTASTSSNSGSNNTATLFASLFSSATVPAAPTELVGPMSLPEPTPLCLSTNAPSSLLFLAPPAAAAAHQFVAPPPPPSPHLSATALLQKAAQMGASASSSSFLRGLGLATLSSSSSANNQDRGLNWSSGLHDHHQKLEDEPPMLSASLGLGLPYENGSGLPDLMIGSSSLFGAKPATLDLLGLGIGPGGSAGGGLSAWMSSIGSGLDASAGPPWDGSDRKPSSSAIL